jgi:hypothetical protein
MNPLAIEKELVNRPTTHGIAEELKENSSIMYTVLVSSLKDCIKTKIYTLMDVVNGNKWDDVRNNKLFKISVIVGYNYHIDFESSEIMPKKFN